MPFIDRLRIGLTALVVFHHAAITYGAEGGWYLRLAPEGSHLLLVLFCTVNQAYFMGFFFLLAGYFTPAALERKGVRHFVLDRLRRLGLPLLVFGLLLDPMTVALAHAHGVGDFFQRWGRFLARGWFSSGPLWFAEALLIFTGLAVPVHRFWPVAAHDLPGHRAILLSALGVGGAAFALRLWFPVGWTISNLQLGYFASYLLLFTVGIIGARGRWLERVTWALARPWLIVSAGALLVLIAAAPIQRWGSSAGGWTAHAVIYAFFEPFFAWGVILTLLFWFRTRFNAPGRVTGFLAPIAFTAYAIHPFVLVGVARMLTVLPIPALLAFVLSGALACIGCVILGRAILLVPGARRVL